ncbi:hypothetical protein AAMO2058_001069600 [Amorphochlora amoebiformis]
MSPRMLVLLWVLHVVCSRASTRNVGAVSTRNRLGYRGAGARLGSIEVFRRFLARRKSFAVASSRSDGYNSSEEVKSNAFGIAKSGIGEFSPTVILVSTYLDENIGSVARSMLNFGLHDLRLVTPQCNHLTDKAKARAAGAIEVLENARVYSSLEEACQDLNMVIATTARKRGLTGSSGGSRPFSSSHDAGIEASESMLRGERVGLLFGPETSGLTTADISHSDRLLYIPTMPSFRALNLAHAVTVVAYEIYAARELLDSNPTPSYNAEHDASLASKSDVETILAKLKGRVQGSRRFKEVFAVPLYSFGNSFHISSPC